MKYGYIFFFCLVFFSGRSQSTSPEVIAGSGDFNTGTTASLSWTLGEIVTETFSTGSNFLTQGFQQPFTANTLGIYSASANKISVFPNPFSEELFFSLNSSKENYSVSIRDFSGKEIENKKLNGFGIQSVQLSHLPSGVYMIHLISSSGNSSSVFKIIKQ